MTQAPATPELVERLRSPEWGEFRSVSSHVLCLEAAAALEAQQARIAELEGLLDLHAAMQSEVERAQAAEEASQALADKYEKALREIQDLPFSATPGRFSSDIARQALSSQGRREGEQDSSSRSQPCADAQERSPGSLHSGGIDDDCPHAGTFRYCAECPVSPCPLGLGRGDNQ